jgi:uncharacterized protein
VSGSATGGTALVVAKSPEAGRVKTRLAAGVGDQRAAELALAALLDTLEVCERVFGLGRRVLALTGSVDASVQPAMLRAATRHWQVVPQRGTGLAARLGEAHRTAHALCGGPVVQIGMDTPHLTARDLEEVVAAARGGLPVLGRAHDGGWWVLASAAPEDVSGLESVPMSHPDTYTATLDCLRQAAGGAIPARQLRDVDTVVDAVRVASIAPTTRFARSWKALAS